MRMVSFVSQLPNSAYDSLAPKVSKYLFPREIYGLDDNLTGIMHNLMKAAGIEVNQPMHVWRHSFAYHMIRGGTKPAYLQQLMGHQDIRTTMSYLKLTQTDVSQKTECLPDF